MGGLANKAKWTTKEVRQRLKADEELSTYEQTLDAGGWRLSAAICALRKEELPIKNYTKKGFGRCAFYKLSNYLPVQTDLFSDGGCNPHTESTTKGQG